MSSMGRKKDLQSLRIGGLDVATLQRISAVVKHLRGEIYLPVGKRKGKVGGRNI